MASTSAPVILRLRRTTSLTNTQPSNAITSLSRSTIPLVVVMIAAATSLLSLFSPTLVAGQLQQLSPQAPTASSGTLTNTEFGGSAAAGGNNNSVPAPLPPSSSSSFIVVAHPPNTNQVGIGLPPATMIERAMMANDGDANTPSALKGKRRQYVPAGGPPLPPDGGPPLGTCPSGGPSLPVECDPKRPWPQCPPQSYCYATNSVDIGPYWCCPVWSTYGAAWRPAIPFYNYAPPPPPNWPEVMRSAAMATSWPAGVPAPLPPPPFMAKKSLSALKTSAQMSPAGDGMMTMATMQKQKRDEAGESLVAGQQQQLGGGGSDLQMNRGFQLQQASPAQPIVAQPIIPALLPPPPVAAAVPIAVGGVSGGQAEPSANQQQQQQQQGQQRIAALVRDWVDRQQSSAPAATAASNEGQRQIIPYESAAAMAAPMDAMDFGSFIDLGHVGAAGFEQPMPQQQQDALLGGGMVEGVPLEEAILPAEMPRLPTAAADSPTMMMMAGENAGGRAFAP